MSYIKLNFRIFRYKQDGSPPYYDTYTVEMRPWEYVLDAVERIWADQDKSLIFRHSCHHASCGSCGMRVNGREKLTCITKIEDVLTDDGVITIEPMRNLPVISDLLVDMTPFYTKMEEAHFAPVRQAEPVLDEVTERPAAAGEEPYLRLEDCIECGLCVSACPITGSDPNYLGPAALAAIYRMIEEPRGEVNVNSLIRMADSKHGLWQCHTAFECSEVCPANVDPAGKIMDLRRRVLGHKVRQLLGMK